MKKITCIVCDKELGGQVTKKYGQQPLDGTAFRTYGHYGSTVFDPMDGSWIELVVCDDCLKEKKHCLYGNMKAFG